MRLLLAVKSCQRDTKQGFNEIIRKTWGSEVRGATLRFFVGDLGYYFEPQEDEVVLDCDDDYDHLPQKVQEILEWSLSRGYDFTYLCDTDTFIVPSRLLVCGFENFDYYGVIRHPFDKTFVYHAIDRNRVDTRIEHCYPWCSGGIGYFLSSKAADIICNSEPNIWCEDLWVGNILIPLHNKGIIKAGDAANFENFCSWHFPQRKFMSQYHPRFGWMEDLFWKYKEGKI